MLTTTDRRPARLRLLDAAGAGSEAAGRARGHHTAVAHPNDVRARRTPARAARPLPCRVPAPLTPLVGRDAEVQDVLLGLADPDVRLVPLDGPGGIGKAEAYACIPRHLSETRRVAGDVVGVAGGEEVDLDPSRTPRGACPGIAQRRRTSAPRYQVRGGSPSAPYGVSAPAARPARQGPDGCRLRRRGARPWQRCSRCASRPPPGRRPGARRWRRCYDPRPSAPARPVPDG